MRDEGGDGSQLLTAAALDLGPPHGRIQVFDEVLVDAGAGRVRAQQGSGRVEAPGRSSHGTSYWLNERRRSESNRRIEVLQTSALPLGYGAGRNVNSQLTTGSARVRVRTVSPESRMVAIMVAGSSGSFTTSPRGAQWMLDL